MWPWHPKMSSIDLRLRDLASFQQSEERGKENIGAESSGPMPRRPCSNAFPRSWVMVCGQAGRLSLRAAADPKPSGFLGWNMLCRWSRGWRASLSRVRWEPRRAPGSPGLRPDRKIWAAGASKVEGANLLEHTGPRRSLDQAYGDFHPQTHY